MKINNVEMQYQSDPKYSGLVMTFPAWQKEPDTIGQYGCLLTAKLNAYNLFNKDKKYLTIQQLNDLVIKHNGYLYTRYLSQNGNDTEKVKKIMTDENLIGKESFQIPEVINWILGIKNEINKFNGYIDIKSKNDYYIIKTKYKDTGHYSLLISDKYDYIDSYDGKSKNPYVNQIAILDIIHITF